jgi:transcriptional regulator with XRE-family HTH domain
MNVGDEELRDAKGLDKVLRKIPRLLKRWRKRTGLTLDEVAASLRARGISIGPSGISRYESEGLKDYTLRSLRVVLGMTGFYGKTIPELAEELTSVQSEVVVNQHFEPIKGDAIQAAQRLKEIELTTLVGKMYGRQFPKRRTPAPVRALIRDYRARQVAHDLPWRRDDRVDREFLGLLEQRISDGYDAFARSVCDLDQGLDRPQNQVLESLIDDWDAVRIAGGLDEYGALSVDQAIGFFDELQADVKRRNDQPARITDQSLHSARTRLALSQVGGLTIWDDDLVVQRHPTMPMKLQFIEERKTIDEYQVIFEELDRAAGGRNSKSVTLDKLTTLKYLSERRNLLRQAIFDRTSKKEARRFDGPLKSPSGVAVTIAQAARAVGIRAGHE